MTAPGANCDIRSYDKSVHLSFCSAAKQVNLTGTQTDISVTPYFIFLNAL